MVLTFQQAYLAMYEFLVAELDASGPHIDLRALLSELAIEPSGTSADPGGVLTFADAVKKVTAAGYMGRYSNFKEPK
jgi:hypothetical protein